MHRVSKARLRPPVGYRRHIRKHYASDVRAQRSKPFLKLPPHNYLETHQRGTDVTDSSVSFFVDPRFSALPAARDGNYITIDLVTRHLDQNRQTLARTQGTVTQNDDVLNKDLDYGQQSHNDYIQELELRLALLGQDHRQEARDSIDYATAKTGLALLKAEVYDPFKFAEYQDLKAEIDEALISFTRHVGGINYMQFLQNRSDLVKDSIESSQETFQPEYPDEMKPNKEPDRLKRRKATRRNLRKENRQKRRATLSKKGRERRDEKVAERRRDRHLNNKRYRSMN